jgi:hypothetical protein
VTSVKSFGRLARAGVAALFGALLALSAFAMIAVPVSAASTPYTDPGVIGQIGLCDQAGHLVTSGTLDAQPFVWRAVSSTPAPAQFAGAGRKATLYAYQPRPNVSADQWSGDQLTATSDYSNPRLPMAQATKDDFTLATFMGEFRPMVDGLYQLRIYFGAPGQGTLNTAYPATDIQITGNTWHALQAPNVSCSDGTSRSSELDTIPPLPQSVGSTGGKSNPGGSTSASSSRTTSATATTRSASPSAPTPTASRASSSAGEPGDSPSTAIKATATSSSAAPTIATVLVVIVLAAAGGGFWWWRRARS